MSFRSRRRFAWDRISHGHVSRDLMLLGDQRLGPAGTQPSAKAVHGDAAHKGIVGQCRATLLCQEGPRSTEAEPRRTSEEE